jgi:hypothetical protein
MAAAPIGCLPNSLLISQDPARLGYGDSPVLAVVQGEVG